MHYLDLRAFSLELEFIYLSFFSFQSFEGWALIRGMGAIGVCFFDDIISSLGIYLSRMLIREAV